MSDILFYIALS